MRTIIAGSRTINDFDAVLKVVNDSGFTISEVVSGEARGVDQLGERYANAQRLPCVKFPANWDKYAKGAGFIRNAAMADYAEALIALWDGKSKGTANMIDVAKKKGLKVFIRVLT